MARGSRTVWLGGMTCLRCARGYYQGYLPDAELTSPCQQCGHIAPAKMARTTFHLMVEARDREAAIERARERICEHCDGKGAPDKGGNIPCAGPGCVLGKVKAPRDPFIVEQR